MPIVEFKNVKKTYTSGEHILNALDSVDLTLEEDVDYYYDIFIEK